MPPYPFQPSRRTAFAGIAAGLASLPAMAQGRREPKAAAPKPEPPKPDAPAPAGDPRFVLRAAPSRRRFTADAAAEAELWTFDGGASVPVLRVKHGEEVFARLVNDTPAPLSLHWHGVRGTSATDGVAGLTQAPVAPGASFDYRFTPPDPGTFLVRPLVPGRSSELAGRGLVALLVVEEREPPPVDADYALLVRDWKVEPGGELAPFGGADDAALGGRLGNRLTVDMSDAPTRIEAAPGARARLRIANVSNARITRLRFDNLKVYVAAVDGQPTDNFEPLRSSLPFPPGARYDVLVDLAREAGARGAITAVIGEGLPLVEVVATGTPSETGSPDTIAAARLPPNRLLPAEIRLQNAVRKDLPIAGGATRGPTGQPVLPADPKAIWTLGGATGAATSPPLFRVKRGQPVVLSLANTTLFPQPIHIHGHSVRVLHGLDDGWEPWWLDTFQVPEGRTSRIAFIADNPGKWVLGSTVLERFDTGLWGWFEVT